MLDIFNTPTPRGANYQEFYGGGTSIDWIKPRGASMVRMLLIGAGGGGSSGAISTANGCNGGGSGSSTEWIGPAIFIPDVLRILIGVGGSGGAASASTANAGLDGSASTVVYQAKDGTGYTLLNANGGGGAPTNAGGAAGIVFANNYFGASGIFTSIAGQIGSAKDTAITASTTTFLSGGAGGGSIVSAAGTNVATNYGYPTITGGAGTTGGIGRDGFFITQPLLMSAGGAGGGGNSTAAGGKGGNGGIGSGGGGGSRGTTLSGAGGRGGDGAVFIWAW